MKKELKYKDEISTPIEEVVFAISALSIFYILVQIFALGNKVILVVLGGFAILLFMIFISRDINAKRVRIQNDRIKNNGIKVYGKIIKYEITNRNDSTHYTLIVEYKDPYTQQLKTYETPDIGFSLCDLGSRECSVYICEDDVYVTDFVPVGDNNKCIWIKENHFLEQIKKEIPKIILKLTFVFFAYMLMFLFFFFIGDLYMSEIPLPYVIGGTIVFVLLTSIFSFFQFKKIFKLIKQIITNQYEFNKIKKINISDIKYCRDIPEKDNILKNYVLANASGLVDEKTNIIGAFLLKWFKDGKIKIKENKKIEKANNNVFESEDEEKLYNLIFGFKENEENIEILKNRLKENKVQVNKWINESYLNIINEFIESNQATANAKIDPNFIPIQEFTLNEELQEQTIKLAGLKKFLKDYTLIEEREYMQIHILEEFLIYAYIFGIADEIEKIFNEIVPSFKEISDFKINDIIEGIKINNPELSENESKELKITSKIFFDI